MLAVVLLIGLVAIGLLGWFPGTAADAKKTQSESFWRSARPIAILESAGGQGGMNMVLMNTESSDVTVHGIEIQQADQSWDAHPFSPSDAITLSGGEKRTVVVDFGYIVTDWSADPPAVTEDLTHPDTICSEGSPTYRRIGIIYETNDGTSGKETGPIELLSSCNGEVCNNHVCAGGGIICDTNTNCGTTCCLNVCCPSGVICDGPGGACGTSGGSCGDPGVCELTDTCACSECWGYQIPGVCEGLGLECCSSGGGSCCSISCAGNLCDGSVGCDDCRAVGGNCYCDIANGEICNEATGECLVSGYCGATPACEPGDSCVSCSLDCDGQQADCPVGQICQDSGGVGTCVTPPPVCITETKSCDPANDLCCNTPVDLMCDPITRRCIVAPVCITETKSCDPLNDLCCNTPVDLMCDSVSRTCIVACQDPGEDCNPETCCAVAGVSCQKVSGNDICCYASGSAAPCSGMPQNPTLCCNRACAGAGPGARCA